MATYEADDRALFEAEGTALYEEIVTSGGLAASDPRVQQGGRAARRLSSCSSGSGSSSSRWTATQWEAEDPAIVQSRVVATR